MFSNFGYILATMFATIATLFTGHVVGDAAPPPPYVNVPGSLLTVPSNFGSRQTEPTQGVPQSALTASAAYSQQAPQAQSAPAPRTPAAAPKTPAPAPTATTSDTKPAAQQGILCHGTYYDACPADMAFQCVDTGRLCRALSVSAQILGTTPVKSDCQIQEDQILAQITALQQNAGDGTDDTAAKIAALQDQYHTLQSTCSS